MAIDERPLGIGMWAISNVPFEVMILMMGGMLLLFHRMAHHTSHQPQITMRSGDAITVKGHDVSSDQCKMTIKDEFGEIDGVSSVAVDIEEKTAKIGFAHIPNWPTSRLGFWKSVIPRTARDYATHPLPRSERLETNGIAQVEI